MKPSLTVTRHRAGLPDTLPLAVQMPGRSSRGAAIPISFASAEASAWASPWALVAVRAMKAVLSSGVTETPCSIS